MYGWTIPDIIDLTLDDVKLIQGAAVRRFKAEEKAYDDAAKGKKTRLPADIDDSPAPTLSESDLEKFKKYGQFVE